MLKEYGLIPEIFYASSFSSDGVCRLQLKRLLEALQTEAIIRDFRNGEWHKYLEEQKGRWAPSAKEVIESILKSGRCRVAPPTLPQSASDEAAWCNEALESHSKTPLTAIVAGPQTAANFSNKPGVSSIEDLDACPWWKATNDPVQLYRNIGEYLKHLRPVFRAVDLVLFIDPYLSPSYPDFLELLKPLSDARRLNPYIKVQVHSSEEVCKRQPQPKAVFEGWHRDLQKMGLRVEVFIWAKFHDRHLLTNLVGVSMQNGFDTESRKHRPTTWSRLTKQQREDLWRTFDPASNPHGLIGRFFVG